MFRRSIFDGSGSSESARFQWDWSSKVYFEVSPVLSHSAALKDRLKSCEVRRTR